MRICFCMILSAFSISSAGFLPLEDPLQDWLFYLEALSDDLLPGVFPSFERQPLQAENINPTVFNHLFNLFETRLNQPENIVAGSSEEGTFLLKAGGIAAIEGLETEKMQSRAGCTLRLHADLLPGLFFDERLSLWLSSDEQAPSTFSPFHEGREEGRHLYVDWGFLGWRHSLLNLKFGRIPQRWGPGRFTSLLISNNSPAIDMLQIEFGVPDKVLFTGFTGVTDSDSSIYLVAHRLDLFPWQKLRIGLSEVILFKNNGPDLAYMNPVIPWYVIQWNEREDDNAFIGLDASWSALNDLVLYGELLIDDFQYLNKLDRPNKLGWTIGAAGVLPSYGISGAVEYTRIDRYVYSQRKECNYYLHHGKIIGSELGPDADRITLSAASPVLWPLVTELRINHTRHGEGTVSEGWPDSAVSGTVFPSGIIEHSTTARIGLSLYLTSSFEAYGNVSRIWVRNAEHVRGSSCEDTNFDLELLFRW